ncbi:MAG: glycerophosphodiester phosphodiesterase family protein [Planctomycetota bacterium]|jgi:glycerophosphoryl diester phosphodiesterase
MNQIGIVNFLRSGLRLLRQGWRQMAVYALIIWLLSLILLAPPTSWALKKLGSNGDVIVGNYGLSEWLLSVQGIAYVLLAGGLIPFSVILYVVGLFWIVNASIDEAALTIRESMARVFAAIPRLIRFSLYVLGVGLVLVLLLGIGLGGIYLSLLSSHDINYYKTIHPPQWYWALALGGTWALCWGVAAGYLVLRSIFVLPIWLEGDQTARGAYRVSWEKTEGKFKPLAGVFGLFLAIWLLACIVLEGGVFAIAGFVLTHLTFSINGILYVATVHLLVSTFLETVLNFIGMAWCICIWVVCYRHVMDSISVRKPVSGISLKQQKITIRLLKILRPRVMVPAIAGLLIISGCLSIWMLWNAPDKMPLPLVIAHRAGAGAAPENTLAALEKAIQDGATDYVEIDVQLTLDGAIVVTHDKDLMKMAGDPRSIRQTSYAELSQVDIGQLFGPEFKGQRLSELSEFLQAGKGRMKFVIEFKYSAGTDLVEKTIQVVNQYGMQDDVVLMSLDLNDIRRSQQLTSDISIGYCVLTEVGDLTQLDVDFVAIQEKNITPKLIRTIQGQGIDVCGWTVDDGKRILELIEMGVNGIITNEPVRVAKIAERYQTLNPAQRTLLSYRRFWDVFYDMGLWGALSSDTGELPGNPAN